MVSGSEFGNRIASQKDPSIVRKQLLQAKTFLGFVKHFSLFAKGVYETCGCNFFSFVIIIVAVVFFNSKIHIFIFSLQ